MSVRNYDMDSRADSLFAMMNMPRMSNFSTEFENMGVMEDFSKINDNLFEDFSSFKKTDKKLGDKFFNVPFHHDFQAKEEREDRYYGPNSRSYSPHFHSNKNFPPAQYYAKPEKLQPAVPNHSVNIIRITIIILLLIIRGTLKILQLL